MDKNKRRQEEPQGAGTMQEKGGQIKAEAEKEKKNQTDGVQAEAAQIEAQMQEILGMDAGDSGAGKNKKTGKNPHRKKRIRRILIPAAVLLLAFLLVQGLRGGKAKAPFVETAQFSRGSITESLTVTGPVEGTESGDVTSNLHAKILELNVKEGDRVVAGETVMAKLDTKDLSKEVELARGNYELAVAQKDEKLKADTEAYQKAVQELNTAQNEYNRQAALLQSGDVARIELEKAQNSLNDAKRAVSSYRVKNGKVLPDESMEIQIRNAELALSQAEDRLSGATIIAPISGTVTRVNTRVGQLADDIEDNKPMITIENLDELQMEIKVSEYSIGKVKPGQAVKITADILGEGNFVNGEVASISPTGEEKGGGSAERVIPTKIRIMDADTALIAGITAKAQIVLDEAKDAFVVPISAVGENENGEAVLQFVTKDEASGKTIIRIVPVKTGLESDLEVEVRDVLHEEDRHFLSEESLYIPNYSIRSDGAEVTTAAAAGSAAESKTEGALDAASEAAERADAGTEAEGAEDAVSETAGAETAEETVS